MTTVCSDNPEIEPKPPVAPVDAFEGTAIGRDNGVDGYRIEVTLLDDGEGRRSGDMAAFTVYSPSDDVVLQVNLQNTTNGKIPAHYDQPHGQH